MAFCHHQLSHIWISLLTVLLLNAPQLILSQVPTPPTACEQQVLAALGQQAAYSPSGYNLTLVWEPSFASSWTSFGCLTSLHSLTMQGAVPQLPATWANSSSFPALQKLDLSNSQLTGTLPPEWGSSAGFPNLLSLDFSNTGLTGPLPAAWGSNGAFPKLVNLMVVGSSLLGSLPAEWGALGGWGALQKLQIGSCDVMGDLPAQWGTATAFLSLQSLDLHDMHVSGELNACVLSSVIPAPERLHTSAIPHRDCIIHLSYLCSYL